MTDPLARLVRQGAEALSVELAPPTPAVLVRLVREVLRFSRRINLVAPCQPEDAVDRHIHDSLAVLRILDRPELAEVGARWLDIGAGGGFPGLALACARPDRRWVLVEPTGKKAACLAQLVRSLELTNVEVRRSRVEQLAPPERPRAALSRATFPPPEWLRRGTELVGPGGLVLLMLGPAADEELLSRATIVDRFSLPISQARRTNALYRV